MDMMEDHGDDLKAVFPQFDPSVVDKECCNHYDADHGGDLDEDEFISMMQSEVKASRPTGSATRGGEAGGQRWAGVGLRPVRLPAPCPSIAPHVTAGLPAIQPGQRRRRQLRFWG